jgi:hypothetical protein
MMRSRIVSVLFLAAAVGTAACEKQLTVQNPNAGETDRVIGTPADAENLIGTYYRRWANGVYNGGGLEGMANIFSLMNYSSLANNCQNSHAPFTGANNFNQPGNPCAGDQSRMYQILGEVNRVASNFITKQDDGSLTLGTSARDARARSFALFLNGISIGYVAMWHDSLAIVSPGMGPEDAGTLVAYKEAADTAYAYLQKAIDEATKPVTGEGGFPIPGTWLPSPTTYSQAEFVRLVRTYRARIRANMARTPAERAAVDWAAVVADAQAGIASDQMISTSAAFNTLGWRSQYEGASGPGLWHQVPPFFIGMNDVSGSYAAWIAQPVGDRGSGNQGFMTVTPDLRFPQGTTRDAQRADFLASSCQAAGQVCKRYFLNRDPGRDQYAGLSWAFSNYDFVRFHSWVISGDAGSARVGNTPIFMKAELNMLQAEGLYRQNNFAAAAALVNLTRVPNGLPAITAFDATTAVPGGANCVPKIPVGPNFNTIACGNLWEAIKYEKRIETAYTHQAPWYLDGRGWGDLPQDSPLFWAVPYQDLQARGYSTAQIYGAGLGSGNAPNSVAAKSVYGW